MKVGVIETETCNLASVRAALRRIGAQPVPVREAEALRGLGGLILPGVGAFGPAMARLRAWGLMSPLRKLLEGAARGEGPRCMAICLGFQLLGSTSEEAAEVEGLGLHSGHIRRLPPGERVPHLGWNEIRGDLSGEAYFAHSFGLLEAPETWAASRCAYGGGFVAALRKGRLTACQFHPELSGEWGQSLLASNLLESASC
ncbi:MAG: imidazole glycerol phosphate synthase subunit HisH [Myxococcota bacterium]